MGQPILQGVDDEVVMSFRVDIPTSDGQHASVSLEIGNRLTKETAAALLHLLHHLGEGVYINSFYDTLWNYDHATKLYGEATEGTNLNPTIFDAFLRASGGRPLRPYVGYLRYMTNASSVFGGAEEKGSIQFYYNYRAVYWA